MKINELDITNLKGISKLKLLPEKLTFFTGPSGTGKSSCMDGIRFAITGKLPKDGLRAGTFALATSVDIDGLGVISRSQQEGKPMKVRMNGKATSAKSVMEMMEGVLGCTASTAAVMTSSEVLRKKDLAAYLLNEGFLKNDMDFDHLVTLCPALTKEAVEELAELLPPMPETISLKDIEKAYELAFTSRAANKKMMAESMVKAQFEGVPPSRTSSEIQAEIEKANLSLGALQVKNIEYPKQKAAFERRELLLKELKEKLAALAHVSAISEYDKTAAKEAQRIAYQLVSDTETAIRTTEHDIATLNKVLEALDSPVCPISKELVCTTDKTVVRDELECEIDSKDLYLSELRKKIDEYHDVAAACDRKIDELTGRERQYQQKLSLKKQYDDLVNMKITIPKKPDTAAEEAMEVMICQLRAELEIAQRYDQAKENQYRADVFKKKYEAFELLVSELAPNGGVRKKVLEHSVGPLEDWCNEKLETVLPKYKMYFAPERDFELMFRDNSENSISYDNLSAGEKVRVTMVVMGMLNVLNGFRILFLDDINALDLDSFKLLLQLIEKSESEYDHVFIAGLNHPGFEDAVKAIESSQVIHFS